MKYIYKCEIPNKQIDIDTDNDNNPNLIYTF